MIITNIIIIQELYCTNSLCIPLQKLDRQFNTRGIRLPSLIDLHSKKEGQVIQKSNISGE